MKNWLTTFFLVLALAGGVLAGMPLHTGNMESKMMDCCDKAKGNESSPQADAARLCCAVNCSESVPTSSGISFNFAPSNITIPKSISEQISALFPSVRSRPSPIHLISGETLPRIFQPRYIQYNSFLI